MALFDTSPLTRFSKFNNFLWGCWFLAKNLSNFVPLVWKLHNPYCHSPLYRLQRAHQDFWNSGAHATGYYSEAQWGGKHSKSHLYFSRHCDFTCFFIMHNFQFSSSIQGKIQKYLVNFIGIELKLLLFTSKRFSLHYERQKEGMIEKGSNRQNGSISGLVDSP